MHLINIKDSTSKDFTSKDFTSKDTQKYIHTKNLPNTIQKDSY